MEVASALPSRMRSCRALGGIWQEFIMMRKVGEKSWLYVSRYSAFKEPSEVIYFCQNMTEFDRCTLVIISKENCNH